MPTASCSAKSWRWPPGETILLDMYGSHWYSNGIYRAWRPGRVYLTDRRLIVYRQEPAEVLFQTPIAEIRDLLINRETYFTGAERDLLYLALGGDKIASVYAEDLQTLHTILVERMAALGSEPAGDLVPFLREKSMGAVLQERVVADGKVWWQAPGSGIHGATWRPGWLYLTVERLLWWSDFERKVEVDIPLGKLRSVNLEQRALEWVTGRRERPARRALRALGPQRQQRPGPICRRRPAPVAAADQGPGARLRGR